MDSLEQDAQDAPKKGWFTRLKEGLKKTSSKLGDGITSLIHKRKLDAQALEDLEEILIQADMGTQVARDMVAALSKERFEKEVTDEEVRTFLAEEVARILEDAARPLEMQSDHKPFVILVVGVNGSGKTTTIGKMAASYARAGKKVRVAAGDTFRAAAVDQLDVWAQRAGVAIVRPQNASTDPASLLYDALATSQRQGDDILMVDTAGRLHNKSDLMAELDKMVRVLKKLDPSAPHACLLVLDATVGQNAHMQVELFQKVANVTGLVITKLDGTAKAGVVVALTQRFGLPIHLIGVGESLEDLQPFEATPFAKGLLGIN